MILSAMALASVTSVSGATKSNMKTKTIAVGDTVNQLEDNTENAANYKWTSSNKAVATVNKKGIVTAKKEGIAVITEISKVGKKEKRVLTTFKVVSLKKQGTKTVVAGEKIQLSKKQYKGATYQWTTSDRSIATVNKKGEVIGNGQGTAVIRCYAQSSKKSYIAQYTIKVNTEKKVVTQSQLTEALSNDKKREYGVSYGIEVTGLLNGKMRQAGIRKGFVILVVNDEKISTPEQLEKMVDRLLKGSSDNQYLVIKGFYPENGRTKIYAIDLAE